MNNEKNYCLENYKRIIELKKELENNIKKDNKIMAQKTLKEICKLYEESTGKNVMEDENIKKFNELVNEEENEEIDEGPDAR